MPVGLVQFADPVCSGSYQKQSPQAKAMRAECVGVNAPDNAERFSGPAPSGRSGLSSRRRAGSHCRSESNAGLCLGASGRGAASR